MNLLIVWLICLKMAADMQQTTVQGVPTTDRIETGKTSTACRGNYGLTCTKYELMCSNRSIIVLETLMYEGNTNQSCQHGVSNCQDEYYQACCTPSYTDCQQQFTDEDAFGLYSRCSSKASCKGTNALHHVMPACDYSNFFSVNYGCISEEHTVNFCGNQSITNEGVYLLFDGTDPVSFNNSNTECGNTCTCSVIAPQNSTVTINAIDIRLQAYLTLSNNTTPRCSRSRLAVNEDRLFCGGDNVLASFKYDFQTIYESVSDTTPINIALSDIFFEDYPQIVWLYVNSSTPETPVTVSCNSPIKTDPLCRVTTTSSTTVTTTTTSTSTRMRSTSTTASTSTTPSGTSTATTQRTPTSTTRSTSVSSTTTTRMAPTTVLSSSTSTVTPSQSTVTTTTTSTPSPPSTTISTLTKTPSTSFSSTTTTRMAPTTFSSSTSTSFVSSTALKYTSPTTKGTSTPPASSVPVTTVTTTTATPSPSTTTISTSTTSTTGGISSYPSTSVTGPTTTIPTTTVTAPAPSTTVTIATTSTIPSTSMGATEKYVDERIVVGVSVGAGCVVLIIIACFVYIISKKRRSSYDVISFKFNQYENNTYDEVNPAFEF